MLTAISCQENKIKVCMFALSWGVIAYTFNLWVCKHTDRVLLRDRSLLKKGINYS